MWWQNLLCRSRRPYISRKHTPLRAPISVEKQDGITLYYWLDGRRMRKTANAFSVAPCTVSAIIKRVTCSVSKFLGNTYINIQQLNKKFNH